MKVLQRKLFLLIVTLAGVVSTILLWNVQPFQSFVILALVLSFFSICANELMFVFYNSLLPSVASKEMIGRVSGWSWGVGYWGAFIALSIALFLFIQPENTPFNLNKDKAEHVRATMILAGVWMLLFSIPLFLFVKEGAPASNLTNPIKILKTGWVEIKKIPGLTKFLFARLFYTDGLTIVFAFAGMISEGGFDN